MNILEVLTLRSEFLIRVCIFYYSPLARTEKDMLTDRHQPVGEPLTVRHAKSHMAEWYAIRGKFMRVTLWRCQEANTYTILKQEQRGNAVVTTIQPYLFA